jgi:hypothetical protein
MKKHKITSLKSLRRQKAALELQIAQEQTELVNDIENIVWPLGSFRRFKKASDDVAGNKFFVVGLQLAQSVLNAALKRKKVNEEHESHGIVDFLKSIADDFLARQEKNTDSGTTE